MPVPRRGVSGRREAEALLGRPRAGVSRRREGEAASMLTTAGLTRSATSAKLVEKPAAGAGAEGAADMTGRVGAETAGLGDSDPVTIAPTSVPMVAERPAEIHAKRRVMPPL